MQSASARKQRTHTTAKLRKAPSKANRSNWETPMPPRNKQHSEGGCSGIGALSNPFCVNTVPIRVTISNQELLVLLDTGCEVDLVSETAAWSCNLPAPALAQSLCLQFADRKQNAKIGKTITVKYGFVSTKGPINVGRNFCVGPVHCDMILQLPWVTKWKMRMQLLQGAKEACASITNERMYLTVLPTAFTSSKARGVESAFQNRGM